ncbi:protein SRC2-like [Lathyrus oleraceus]|uniref:protein SRC2-like n=1 Tax=Pisum sativum TaxID=3888 RepID=UPI0021D219C8|nr:protein SRC2-like [Pisum sativum]
MSSSPKYSVNVHCNGEIYESEFYGCILLYPYGVPYGVPAPALALVAPQQQPQGSYYSAAPPTGYPQTAAYSAPAPPQQQQQPGSYYSAAPQAGYPQTVSYGSQSNVYVQVEEKKKSKFGGMGTGLAMGAVAGVLGGVALVEGAEFIEEKFSDDDDF